MKQLWFSILVLGCMPGVSFATPESKSFDDYTIHLNAFNSDTLQPSMAKAYNIIRSKNRGLLTISIVKKSLSSNGVPVKANVKAKATNLTGQLKDIRIREIHDGDAVYYISEFSVADKEVLDFTIQVTPHNNGGPYVVEMRQQFFTQ
ncbi:MAG: DUF4426 domain-containing protein [Gammaproteobacteria bacterium]